MVTIKLPINLTLPVARKKIADPYYFITVEGKKGAWQRKFSSSISDWYMNFQTLFANLYIISLQDFLLFYYHEYLFITGSGSVNLSRLCVFLSQLTCNSNIVYSPTTQWNIALSSIINKSDIGTYNYYRNISAYFF